MKDRLRSIQITPVIAPFIPMFGQTVHVCHQDVCFYTEFPWSQEHPWNTAGNAKS